MADLKISQLPAAATLTGDEDVPLVQGGTTVRGKTRAVQRVRVNTQTVTNYAMQSSDAGGVIRCDNASPVSVTVGSSGFAVGDVVGIRQVGLGQVTVSGGTLSVPAGAQAKTRAQGSTIALHCVAADTFDVLGDLA